MYKYNHQNVYIPDSVVSLSTHSIVDTSLSKIIFTKDSNLASIPNGCFWQVSMESFLCPPKVKTIETNAFYFCSLTTFDVMEGSILTTIQSKAFCSNNLLSIVSLPDTITELTAESFTGCTSLKVINIDSSYFKNVNGTIYSKDMTEFIFIPPTLPSFVVAAEIESIGQSLFQRCENMTSLTVNQSNENYYSEGNIIYQKSDNGAFCAAGGIEEAIVSNKATYLASSIFKDLKKLKKISFEAVSICTEFHSNAFDGCTALSDVEIPQSVEKIGYKCFSSCHKIESIILPKNLTSIESYGFGWLEGLKSITCDPDCKLKNLGATVFISLVNLRTLEIPNSLECIVESTFYKCGITSLHIPSGTKIISKLAFEACANLEELIIDLDSELTSIGDGSFQNCPRLKKIKIPLKLQTISSAAFARCGSLVEIEYLGECALGSIDSQSFEGTKIENFTIPSTVLSLSSTSFAKCSNLKNLICSGNPTMRDYDGILFDSTGEILLIVPAGRENVVIKEGTKTINSQALYYCTELKTLTFKSPCEVSSIGKYSFYQCVSLMELEIPSSINFIEAEAFVSCNLLRNVTFAKGSMLEVLKSSTFLECRKLEYIKFEDGSKLHTIDSEALTELPLKEFEAPNLIKSIGSNTFKDCKELSKIDLSLCRNLTSISSGCFHGCVSFSIVNFSSSITIIGENSFKGCAKLSELATPINLKKNTIRGICENRYYQN